MANKKAQKQPPRPQSSRKGNSQDPKSGAKDKDKSLEQREREQTS